MLCHWAHSVVADAPRSARRAARLDDPNPWKDTPAGSHLFKMAPAFVAGMAPLIKVIRSLPDPSGFFKALRHVCESVSPKSSDFREVFTHFLKLVACDDGTQRPELHAAVGADGSVPPKVWHHFSRVIDIVLALARTTSVAAMSSLKR